MTGPAAGYVRVRHAGRRTAHLLAQGGAALCPVAHPAGRRWLVSEGLPVCRRCVKQAVFLAEVAAYGGVIPRPGIVAVLERGKVRVPAGECASCGKLRLIPARGLCRPCTEAAESDGTLAEYGWVRSDRVAEFGDLRSGGLLVHEAASRVGVSLRTGWRYEQALASTKRAPWRSGDPGAAGWPLSRAETAA